MRVYKEVADGLSKEDRADFYDALIGYALDDAEPGQSTGAAVFHAVRRMVDTWKMKSAAGKASAAKRGNVFGGCSEGVRNTTRTDHEHSVTKEEKNKSINNNNLIKKQGNSLNKKQLKKRPEQDKQNATKVAEVRLQDVVDLYNSICRDMPKARALTDTRRKHIQARLKDNGPEVFREVFERAEASDFLSGRIEGKDFRANFDWIVGYPQHWQRILEGVYDNRAKVDALDMIDRAADALIGSADPEAVADFERSMNGGYTA